MRVFSALIVLVIAAASADAAAPLPEATVTLGGQRYTVEIASTDASRMRGLMFRDSMPPDRGMLFVFEAELPLAFWMKNTRIPLDILYFNDRLELVSMALDTPPCTTPYCPPFPSAQPARYVLELNAGQAAALGLATGAILTIEPGSTRPKLD